MENYKIYYRIVNNEDVNVEDYLDSPCLMEEVYDFATDIACLQHYKGIRHKGDNLIIDDKYYGVSVKILSVTVFVLIKKWKGFEDNLREDYYDCNGKYFSSEIDDLIKDTEAKTGQRFDWAYYIGEEDISINTHNYEEVYYVRRYYKDFQFAGFDKWAQEREERNRLIEDGLPF